MRRLASSVAFLGLLLLSTSPVTAQDVVLGGVQLASTTIDVHTRLPTVTVSVTCLKDSDFVRIRLTLTQKAPGRESSSQQTTETTCVAGTTVTTAIVFGPQQGTFRPGRAEIQGFVAANNVGLLDDVIGVPPTTVLLLPG